MRRFLVVLFVVLAGGITLPAQTPAASGTPPPQTARQALIEMFFGKGAGDFEKHLPADTHRALIRKGDTPESSTVLKISMIGRQMVAQGEHIETFDLGPNLLVSEQSGGREKTEVVVEHDSLMGEDDEIELSVNYYKDGKLQFIPVVPRLVFTLKQEKEIWRLTDINVSAHVPLTDPDYLKGVRKEQDEEHESQVRMRLAIIAGAENSYAANHPDRGYSCTLASLFERDPGAAAGEAPAYDPGQGSEDWQGYRFTLAGCEGTPASKYRVTAAPTDVESGLKAFCSDESGPIKSISGRKSTSCFSRGQAVGKEAGRGED